MQHLVAVEKTQDEAQPPLDKVSETPVKHRPLSVACFFAEIPQGVSLHYCLCSLTRAFTRRMKAVALCRVGLFVPFAGLSWLSADCVLTGAPRLAACPALSHTLT